MKNYFWNFALVALVACVAGILTFLCGASMAAAMVGGVYSGLATALSYQFGRMMAGAGYDGKMLLIQVIAAVVFGLFGGWMLTIG